MRLTSDDVNTSSAALISRAESIIAKQEGSKTWIGGVFTDNNDTIEQTQGAMRMLSKTQIPRWRDNGLAIVAAEDDDKVDGWLSVAKDFTSAIDLIDHAGDDATLQSVARRTVEATATQVREGAGKIAGTLAGLVPWQVWVGAAAALAIVIAVVARKARSA